MWNFEQIFYAKESDFSFQGLWISQAVQRVQKQVRGNYLYLGGSEIPFWIQEMSCQMNISSRHLAQNEEWVHQSHVLNWDGMNDHWMGQPTSPPESLQDLLQQTSFTLYSCCYLKSKTFVWVTSFIQANRQEQKQEKKPHTKSGDLKPTCFSYSSKAERENNLPTNLLRSHGTSPATCIKESASKMSFQISHLWCAISTCEFNIMGNVVN